MGIIPPHYIIYIVLGSAVVYLARVVGAHLHSRLRDRDLRQSGVTVDDRAKAALARHRAELNCDPWRDVIANVLNRWKPPS